MKNETQIESTNPKSWRWESETN